MEVKNNTAIIQLIVNSRYRVLRHVILLFAVFLLLYGSDQVSQEHTGLYRYYRLLSIYIVLMTTFYINMNILVPRFFFKNQYIIYLLLLLVLVKICLSTITFFLNDLWSFFSIQGYHIENESRGAYEGTIMVISVILITTMMRLFQRWIRDNEKITELNNLTMMMEMKGLKNQINPHFLFNMLNGIKALVRTDQEKAVIVIMKLSEFLRYQLYENNEEKVLLKSEIVFLTNFLDLEKLRRDNLSVDIKPSKNDYLLLGGILIPPNLFTTFVENAVKHSVTMDGSESYVRINITIDSDRINFLCINSIDSEYIPSKGKSSGLGLANIKRRLALLYGEEYSLDIDVRKNGYSVNLRIPL